MDMIEKVARALCASSGTIWGGPRGEDDPDFLLPKMAYMRMARTAIEAMWTPTKGMMTACWPLYHPWGVNAPAPEERPENFADMEVEITAKWQAMIDAALVPSPPLGEE